MSINIACVHCGDFFLHVPGEARTFLNQLLKGDLETLRQDVPCLPPAQKLYNSYADFLLAFLEAHCPYCRSVLFDDTEALKTATRRELRESGGFYQVHNLSGKWEESWRHPPGGDRENGPVTVVVKNAKKK